MGPDEHNRNENSSVKKRRWIVVLLLFSFHSAFGQFENFKVTAKKTASAPVIDGFLNEEAWENAPFISDFIQFEPKKGEPESVKTILKILYDDTHIYFGYYCFDPEPEKLVLGTRRDGLTMGVDSADVALDTLDDKRSGYYFRTNPLASSMTAAFPTTAWLRIPIGTAPGNQPGPF